MDSEMGGEQLTFLNIRDTRLFQHGTPVSNSQTFVHWVPLSSLPGYATKWLQKEKLSLVFKTMMGVCVCVGILLPVYIMYTS